MIGLGLLILVGYMNCWRDTKDKTIEWIRKHIFRHSFDSRAQAEALFDVTLSLVVTCGGLLIVASVFILANAQY